MINPRQIIQESSDAMSECIACIPGVAGKPAGTPPARGA
jgi:hypothetical protein